jgi:serine/threonine protein kinase
VFQLRKRYFLCSLSSFVLCRSSLYIDRAVLGTPGYMCPKYAHGGSEYDAESENFSFGIVLLELLLGRLQGQGKNDLIAFYIEDETPVSVDMRARPWI